MRKNRIKKIYLAGFDVFRPDALAFGQVLQEKCQAYGFEGLYPLDNQAPIGLQGVALAQWIYQANIDLINQSEIVIANLNQFRGFEPDSGTVFEVGYAIAQGKIVLGYSEQQSDLKNQISHEMTELGAIDASGYVVEDFGLRLNLMIACSVNYLGHDFESCLRYLAN